MSAVLGGTSDPTALIPGDLPGLYDQQWTLQQYAGLLADAYGGLQRVSSPAGWKGAAADAFRHKLGNHLDHWRQACDAFGIAAKALDDYAGTLAWAQDKATEAIALWKAGRAGQDAATAVLNDARQNLAGAAAVLAGKLQDAAALAPPPPSFWDQVGGFFTGVGSDLATVGTNVLNGAASIANSVINNPGAAAESAGGLLLTGLSAGGEGLGAALAAAGVGAPEGLALGAVSASGIATGAGLTGLGAARILGDAAGPDQMSILHARAKPSSSGGGTAGGDPPKKISGLTGHGRLRAMGRDGHGVNDAAMDDAVARPVKPVQPQADETYKYVGKNATVVLNEDGQVVTTWANTRNGWRNP